MWVSRRWALRFGVPLVAAVVFSGLAFGLGGLRVSYAQIRTASGHEQPWQVTVFAIIATPESKAVDSKLTRIQAELNRLLPHHGFKLLDAQMSPLVAGESVDCNLGHGYTAETTLVRPLDEDGKVQLRCELFLDETLQFSANVKAPLNQLFFCERPFLDDGSKLLIGIGVR
jgi:hypothetical protein